MYDRQFDCDVDVVFEVEHFDWCVVLVVVHRDDEVEVVVHGVIEGRVGWEWILGVDFGGACGGDRGCEFGFFFVVVEQFVLVGVRIDPVDGDAWCGDFGVV